jgi:hypothetical protein
MDTTKQDAEKIVEGSQLGKIRFLISYNVSQTRSSVFRLDQNFDRGFLIFKRELNWIDKPLKGFEKLIQSSCCYTTVIESSRNEPKSISV